MSRPITKPQPRLRIIEQIEAPVAIVKTSKPRAERTKIYYRRQLVAMLWLTGQYNYEQLAAKLKEEGINVRPRVVQDDIAFLKRAWRQQGIQEVATLIEAEVAKLDQLEDLLVTKLRSNSIDAASFTDRYLKICDRRAKLLGLDQPTKLHVTNDKRPIGTLSDADLEDVIRGEVRRLVQPSLTLDSRDVKKLTEGSIQ